MEKSDEIKQAIADLMDNLGDIGSFMLGEARSFLRKGTGASKEEFMEAVDKAAKVMMQSGKLAREDVERTAKRIKDSWELLDKEKDLDWSKFLDDVRSNLSNIGDLTEDTFERCVNQARDGLDKQWSAMGRLGEDHLKRVQEQSEEMAESFRGQWGTFWDHMEKTGKKVDRAVDAAWDEIKKKTD